MHMQIFFSYENSYLDNSILGFFFPKTLVNF